MGDTVPQSAQSGGGELVQRVPPHLVSLPSHVEDDGAAHQLVGHDQERRGRVEGTFGGRGQVILLHLQTNIVQIHISSGCLSGLFTSIYRNKHPVTRHYNNYPAI